MCTYIKSVCCTPKMNTMLCVNYISVKNSKPKNNVNAFSFYKKSCILLRGKGSF